MTDYFLKTPKLVLDPIDRITEVLFGLIMVLTFTASLSVVSAGRNEIRTMFYGALGCNLAWGIIDAALYLMGCLAERGKGLLALHALRSTKEPEKGHALIAAALPRTVAGILVPSELESMRQRILALPEPPKRAKLRWDDWRGALAVFLLVFFSTIPVVIPFIFVRNTLVALRISNGIAIILLFLTGYAFGRITRHIPWLYGSFMVFIGLVLVGIAMACGG